MSEQLIEYDYITECFFKYGTTNHEKTIKYRLINGTAYHEKTIKIVIDYIEKARLEHGRVRFSLGDTQTGIDWGVVLDCRGYIGRSMGEIKIPLLIKNSRSTGGSGLLDHCIIKLEYKGPNDKSYREVYRHKKYQKRIK
jgi:hypothetical protein